MGLSAGCLRKNQTLVEVQEEHEKILITKPVQLGIGNPGVKYESTRHNIGKQFLEYVSKELSLNWKNFGLYDIIETEQFILIKSNAYMNVSASCLMDFSTTYTLDDISNLVVVCDLLEKDIGKVYLKQGGGDKGNYGLRSIHTFAKDSKLPVDKMNKLLLGIGKPESLDAIIVADWVLGKWQDHEKQVLYDETFPAAQNTFQRKILKENIEKFKQNTKMTDIKLKKKSDIKVEIPNNQQKHLIDKNLIQNKDSYNSCTAVLKQKDITFQEKISKQLLKEDNDSDDHVTKPEKTVVREIVLFHEDKNTVMDQESSIDSDYFQTLEKANPSPKQKNMSYTASVPVLHMSPKRKTSEISENEQISNFHKKSQTKEEKKYSSVSQLPSKFNESDLLDNFKIEPNLEDIKSENFSTLEGSEKLVEIVEQEDENLINSPNKNSLNKDFNKQSKQFSCESKNDVNKMCGSIDLWQDKDSDDTDATLKYNDWKKDLGNGKDGQRKESFINNVNQESINMNKRKNVSPQRIDSNGCNLGRGLIKTGYHLVKNVPHRSDSYKFRGSNKKYVGFNNRTSPQKRDYNNYNDYENSNKKYVGFYKGSSPQKKDYNNYIEYEKKPY